MPKPGDAVKPLAVESHRSGDAGSMTSGGMASAGMTPGSAAAAVAPIAGGAAGGATVGVAEDKSPRERILQASLELFVEQGYFNTNVPDISRRSRCSVGSIYHHFLNKEEIAAQIFHAGMKDFRTALAKSIDSKRSVEQNVSSIVVVFLGFAEANHMMARYLWLARHSEFLNHQVKNPTMVGFDELGRRVTKLLRRAEREGNIPNLPAEVIWTLLFGLPVSYMRDWLDGYTRIPPSKVAPAIANACWAAMCGMKPVEI